MSTIADRIARQKREEHSYKKMLSFGWTPEQASGIVGNLKYESNLETTREGDVGYKGGSSFGIAQFRGNRLQKLKEMYGKDWTDLDNQLDFVNWELNNTHKKAGDRLRQVKGVYNTGRVMSDDYEIPAKKWNSNDDRQRAVFDLHQKYSGVALTDEDRANFNKKKERTSSFTNFEMAENRGNLATVPDVEEKPEVVEAIKTLDSKQNEMNFLKEMFSKQNEDFTVVEPKKVVAQQIAPTNIMETYDKINSFVEAQQGGVIEDNKGQWAYPGDVTKIDGGNITMKGVNYPVLGVSDKGEQQMMYPNKNYQFQGAESVTEYPQLTEKEKNFLKAVQNYKNRK